MIRSARLSTLLVLFLCLVLVPPLALGHGGHHAQHDDEVDVAHSEAGSSIEAAHEHQPPAGHSHSHMHSEAPKLVLNETEVLRQHGPSPPSYYDMDTGVAKELHAQHGSHSAAMTAHVVFMIISFVFALPLHIYFKTAHHPFLAGFTQFLFLATFGLGLLTGGVYSASTPQLYKGHIHSKLGWITFFLAVGLSFAQILRAGILLFSSKNRDVPFSARLRHLLVGGKASDVSSSEAASRYALLEPEDEDEVNEAHFIEESTHDLQRPGGVNQSQRHVFPPSAASTGAQEYWKKQHRRQETADTEATAISRPGVLQQWHSSSSAASSRGGVSPSGSNSDETLHEEQLSPRALSPPIAHGPQSNPPRISEDELEKPFSGPKLLRGGLAKPARVSLARLQVTKLPERQSMTVMEAFLKYGEIFLWRILPLFAWAGIISGVAIYGGACRDTYLNGCMAHLIKGSIFFWYGLLSFGRYAGAWAELGWAWNRKPDTKGTWREHFPSAEMVECFIIFLYGATNTWMERFGAKPGDPYTLHEVQHISIAVMYFFAGGAGMMLESKTVRNWVSNAILERVDTDKATPPSSYSGSFNIFPAVCIGVTGIAMSAHHQEYQFSVTVHALWGTFLAGFAVLRILTYTFLYLRPPASILPSRPPTEALASFCLAAGGIVFILSTEEVIFWAMRNEADDTMAMMNVTVSFICFMFAWILGLMALRGWATRRSGLSSRAYRSGDSTNKPVRSAVSFDEPPSSAAALQRERHGLARKLQGTL